MQSSSSSPPHLNDPRRGEPTEPELEGRVQPLANDIPWGPDLLAIEHEVHALAEAIALKDMRPPLVVGVLGGWGAGKSFVLHLLEEHLGRIRCENLTPGTNDGDRESAEFPYVGHPYVIRFDAWTYAKSDLWASLMQTIFLELNRQIGLEQRLQEELGLDLRTGTAVWRLLSRLSPSQLEELQQDPLSAKAIARLPALEREVLDAEDLWHSLRELKVAERNALEASEQALAEERSNLELARLALEAEVERELAERTRREAFAPFRQELRALLGAGWQEAWEERPPEFDELTRELSTWNRLRRGWSGGATAFALVALVALLAPWLLGRAADLGQQLAAWTGAALAAVLAHLETLRSLRRWLEERQAAYRRHLEGARERRGELRDHLREEKLQTQRAVLAASTGEAPIDLYLVPALELRVQELEAEVDGHRRNVGLTARHPSLLDFVRGRLESRFYDRRLGLLHQAQRDLADLTAALLPHPTDGPLQTEARRRLFPRGEPRVILMIDDLDRCPPARVVEVLEAAQLMVKTQLFVVVLAMDVRYVTRALERVYTGVLSRDGEPSGLDYIEKIVQIPYRVRPIREEALEPFLRSQMHIAKPLPPELPPESPPELSPTRGRHSDDLAAELDHYALEGDFEMSPLPKAPGTLGGSPSVPPPVTKGGQGTGDPQAEAPTWLRGTLPTRVQEFDRTELELLTGALGAVDVSPRAARRLVNVCKLLKIIWYRRGLGAGPAKEVKQAMVGLLAAAAYHPEVARDLLAELEGTFHEKPTITDLLGFLHDRCENGCAATPQTLRDATQKTLTRVLPEGVALSSLGRDNLTLVSSFSFVGESEAHIH